MTIKTDCIHPPIPTRCFDWSAIDADTYDGAPDSPNRNQIGYGATENDAVEDLKAQLIPETFTMNIKNLISESHRRQFNGEDYQGVAIDIAEGCDEITFESDEFTQLMSSPSPDCDCGFCKYAPWKD